MYSRVAGWSWVLWYPTYFLRGFAIHGYPDVPTYPASHFDAVLHELSTILGARVLAAAVRVMQ